MTTLAAVVGLAGAAGSAQECLSPLGSLSVVQVHDLAAAGHLVHLAAGGSGLLVVDLSDPSEPALVGTYDPPAEGIAWGVAVDGTLSYVAAGLAGMRIVDVTDPFAPVEVGAVTGGHCSDVEVADGLAYLAMEQDGLWIVDVTDPQATMMRGVYLYGYAGRVSLGSHYAFVAGGPGTCGSRILDVSDPTHPVVAVAPTVGEFNEAAVQGRYAYLVHGCVVAVPSKDSGPRFSVVDLEAPDGPTQVGSLELPEHATGVAVSGSLAFVAGLDRVYAVDVTDPTLPIVAWSYRPVTGAGDLALAGSVAVVAGRGEVELLDLSGCEGAFVSSFLMGAAHLEGDAGTQWRTDVEVCNLDPVERHAEMAFLERGQANLDPATVAVTYPAGQCTRYEDIVSSLFGLGEAAGTVRLTSTSRLPCSARTYNLTTQGSYGSFKLGRPGNEAIRSGDTGALIQLSHSASLLSGSRTNLELVNLTGGPITVEVDLYSAGGTHLGMREWELAASEDVHIGKVFEYVITVDVDDGYALVRTPTPGGAFLATASVVDNLTGDGSSVPVIRR